MFIDNGVFKIYELGQNLIGGTLPAGTPINVGGQPCNDGTAVGILVQSTRITPENRSARVLVGGDVLLAEVQQMSGLFLTNDAVQAMHGIHFHLEDGTVYHEGHGGGDNVLTIREYADQEWTIASELLWDVSARELWDAVNAGKMIVVKGDGYTYYPYGFDTSTQAGLGVEKIYDINCLQNKHLLPGEGSTDHYIGIVAVYESNLDVKPVDPYHDPS